MKQRELCCADGSSTDYSIGVYKEVENIALQGNLFVFRKISFWVSGYTTTTKDRKKEVTIYIQILLMDNSDVQRVGS